MEIIFTKLSDIDHAVRIRRTDGSEARTVLNSRSFLRHDLAHLAVELEVPLAGGYWGSVAQGAALDGMSIRGPDIITAETLAGPTQTLMRLEADAATFYDKLVQLRPALISPELASRIRERGRRLQGHWRATPYGGDMIEHWTDPVTTGST